MFLAAKERPYLVDPLGPLDDDPETIVTFIGYKAVPAKPKTDAYLWNRGRITIAFSCSTILPAKINFFLSEKRDSIFSGIS